MVLCAGFEHVRDEAGPVEQRVSSDYLLTFEEARLLLQRCREWGADVGSITHYSQQDDDLDELWVSIRDFASPEDALQDVRQQGCSELFSVSLGVSDEAFEAWKAQQG